MFDFTNISYLEFNLVCVYKPVQEDIEIDKGKKSPQRAKRSLSNEVAFQTDTFSESDK